MYVCILEILSLLSWFIVYHVFIGHFVVYFSQIILTTDICNLLVWDLELSLLFPLYSTASAFAVAARICHGLSPCFIDPFCHWPPSWHALIVQCPWCHPLLLFFLLLWLPLPNLLFPFSFFDQHLTCWWCLVCFLLCSSLAVRKLMTTYLHLPDILTQMSHCVFKLTGLSHKASFCPSIPGSIHLSAWARMLVSIFGSSLGFSAHLVAKPCHFTF